MAAVTAVIAAGVALAGLGIQASKAIKEDKLQKQSAAEAKATAKRIQGLTEANPFREVQVPTLGFELAQQGIDRSSASTLNALQGAGAEGVVGGVNALMQTNREQELELAAKANEAKYQRDFNEAQVQGGINQRKIERVADLEQQRLNGAQLAMAQAQQNKNAAIEGMFASAGSAATTIAGAQTGAYRAKSDKALYGKAPAGTTVGYDVNGNEIYINPYSSQPSYLGSTSALSNTIQFK